jgi:hypothetical protein
MSTNLRNEFSGRKFGVELEMGNEVSQSHIADIIKANSLKEVRIQSGWGQTNNNHFWHVKYDGSCGAVGKPVDSGWEVASFVASGATDLNCIADMATKLHQGNCLVNKNCGLHIHCDVSDFTVNEMGVLLARWMKIEPMLCNLMPSYRVDNYYCRLISKSRKIAKSKKHTAETVWLKLKPTKYGPHDNRQKKVTLNTVGYAQALACEASYYPQTPPSYLHLRKTVEFRMPEGTLRREAIVAWVTFLIRFIDSAKTSRMPIDLKPLAKIKDFFKYCGLTNSDINNCNLELFDTKLFLIERFFTFGDDDIKKQFNKGLF